jgi:hypothetical protein
MRRFIYNLIIQRKKWYLYNAKFMCFIRTKVHGSTFNSSFFLNDKDEFSQTAFKLLDSTLRENDNNKKKEYKR